MTEKTYLTYCFLRNFSKNERIWNCNHCLIRIWITSNHNQAQSLVNLFFKITNISDLFWTDISKLTETAIIYLWIDSETANTSHKKQHYDVFHNNIHLFWIYCDVTATQLTINYQVTLSLGGTDLTLYWSCFLLIGNEIQGKRSFYCAKLEIQLKHSCLLWMGLTNIAS